MRSGRTVPSDLSAPGAAGLEPHAARSLVRRGLRLADLALVSYFAVAAAVALLPSLTAITRGDLVAELAFSPSDLVSGRLWLLPLSGLVVDGDAWPQLAVLVPTAVLLVATAGARTFWRAAIAAHVGSRSSPTCS